MTWQQDKAWADLYTPEIARVLKENAHQLIEISIANDEMDTKQATDYIIQVTGGTVAARVRKSTCKFRDLTIRYSRPSGVKTEIHKILEGWGDWYLYAWVSARGLFEDHALVDLNKLRESGLLEKDRPKIANPDGTRFIAISLSEMHKAGCLLDWLYKGKRKEAA